MSDQDRDVDRDRHRDLANSPMIAPTTEDAYQQTEVVYRPTSESIQSKFKKIKNPLKVPQALLSPDRSQPPLVLDPNIYSTKKTVMTILCLIIIIMANSMQLKFVIKNSGAIHSQFYSAQLGLGVTSVILAAFIGLILMYSARLNYNDTYKQRKLDFINNLVMILIFFLCILNIFIIAMN